MYWTSLLPVTIVVLAHTLGVSQSAATGRERLMGSEGEAVGGGSRQLQEQEEQLDDDNDLAPLHPADFSSSASSIESPVPHWINLRPDKDNALLDENDDEDWEEMPLSSNNGKIRYDQLGRGGGSDVSGLKDTMLVQLPSYTTGTTNSNNNRLMLLTPQDLASLHRYYFKDGKVKGGGLMKRGDQLKRMYLATKLREQKATPAESSRTRTLESNYRIPAESNIVRGNFDKRSPRCIANCMRQGLVHPIQCHSLCR